MNGLEELKKITEVSESEEDRAKFEKDYSLVPPCKPDAVVRPKNRDEVAEVVIACNDHNIPIYPASSKVHFNGGTIPRPSKTMPRPVGIIMDLSGMNKIERLNEDDMWGYLEVGVTWEQYAEALKEKGYRTTMPLLPHAERSVIMDWLEREQSTIPMFEYSEQIGGMWVVWGLGEKFVTGSASSNTFGQPGNYAAGVNPQGPGTIDFWRLLQGSQGTLGIVTKAVVKFERIPKIEKVYFIPSERLDDLIDPVYDILERRVGYERFIVNNLVFANMIAENKDEILKLRDKLPPYVFIMIVGGLYRKPEMHVEYQEDYLKTTFKQRFPNVNLVQKLEGVEGVEERLPEMLKKPWPKDKTYWKHMLKGRCQDLVFMTTLEKAPTFCKVIRPIVEEHGYPVDMIGHYIQPVEEGRACQVTYSFYYSEDEKDKILKLYKALIPAIWEAGGFFNRPYEYIAQYVYPKAPDYTAYLMRVKKLFDPNMILSPGKLCFWV